MNEQKYERYSAELLNVAAELQEKKGKDYQSKASIVRQADYYPNGVNSILDIVNAKMLRTRSVLAMMEAGEAVNFESVEDSMFDMINYASFLIAYMHGEIDGQLSDRDIFNRNAGDINDRDERLMPRKFRNVWPGEQDETQR